MIWYNARLMSDKKGTIKYMKCKSDGLNITQDDVLYMTSWPAPGTKIYIVEGEFDAISLSMAGFVGCALGGKSISDAQIEMIRKYVPVLAFDADEGWKKDAGVQALINVGTKLLERGFPQVSYVRPPKVYKDWNKVLVERSAEVIRAYINMFEKPFTSVTPSMLLAQHV
jgi:DNA primase